MFVTDIASLAMETSLLSCGCSPEDKHVVWDLCWRLESPRPQEASIAELQGQGILECLHSCEFLQQPTNLLWLGLMWQLLEVSRLWFLHGQLSGMDMSPVTPYGNGLQYDSQYNDAASAEACSGGIA